jgi:hypothetical protein
VEENAVARPGRIRETAARKPEIDRAVGRVAKREAGQHAIARDGMEIARDAMLHAVKRGRRTLANAVRVVAMTAAPREPGDQRRFEKKPLRIDDLVITASAQRANEIRDLVPCRRRQQALPPASRGDRNDLRNRGMKPHEGRERLLHHPRKSRIRKPAARIRQRGHVMDHVAERGRLDEQNLGHVFEARRVIYGARSLVTGREHVH